LVLTKQARQIDVDTRGGTNGHNAKQLVVEESTMTRRPGGSAIDGWIDNAHGLESTEKEYCTVFAAWIGIADTPKTQK